MDFGRLIGKSWHLTWRHRFLWVLGLFAASSVGSCGPTTGGSGTSWQVSPSDVNRLSPEVQVALRQVGTWLEQNAGAIFLVVAAAAVLGLIFLVLSVISQGGMALATADLALGQPSSLGQAWGAGLRLFWRYLALWILVMLFSLLVVAVVAVLVAALIVVARMTGEPLQAFVIGVAILLGIVATVVGIPFFIAVTVVMAFAQRAIAVENVGPVAGLQAGIRVLRGNLGNSILVWLVNLALSIGVGILGILLFVLLALPVAVGAYVLFAIAGVQPAVIFVVVAALIVFAVMWVVGAIVNTYFWNYWTLAYLRFTGRLTDQLEVQP